MSAVAKSQVDIVEEQIRSLLLKLGAQKVGDDALTFEGTKVIIPEMYRNDMSGFIRFLKKHIEGQNEVHVFSRKFNYHPHDGAMAVVNGLKRYLGVDVVGSARMSFFGPIPPQMLSVQTGVGQYEQAPWGDIDVTMFGGTMSLSEYMDEDYGLCFQISVEAPRKNAGLIESLFKLVEDELEQNSIYRGKAIDGAKYPNFRDPFLTDAGKIIYTGQVEMELRANIWTYIEHTQALRDQGVSLKRAVLLYGPYGTGKTEAANVTAQKSTKNGWTFLYCRPGKDDIADTMKKARNYQPSVVFLEDVDKLANDGNADHVSELLDLFDGLDAKNNEIMVILTTNHVDKIHTGMLRPGRLDALIHVSEFDDEAREKLVRALVPKQMLARDIDFAAINVAMDGYQPAFIKETIDRVKTFATSRLEGDVPTQYTTADFVFAATSLRGQFELHQNGHEGVVAPTLDTAVESAVARALAGTSVFDMRNDALIGLTPAAEGGYVYSEKLGKLISRKEAS